MRKFPALIALAALIPWTAFAQTKVGVVPEAGLTGAPLSPAATLNSPSMSAAVPSLTGPVLAPSFAAPAITVTPSAPALAAPVVPAAAKPVVPAPLKGAAPAVLTSALSAIKPSASTPDKPGSDAALAAGNALFDGAAKLSAPAIGDGFFRRGSKPSKRSSGLSPPTDAELAAAYKAAKPGSPAVEMLGRDFVAAAAEAMQKYTFMGDYFLRQVNPASDYYRVFADLVAVHDARRDSAARAFSEMLGRWVAHREHGQELLRSMKFAMMKKAGAGGPAPHLTPSPIEGGEYWDMAAGMNAQGFIHRELDAKTNYVFFDYSPFVVSYLKTAAELAGKPNAAVVEADLNALTKPEKPIAVLRTKNAVHYVPGFDKKLEEMADWIAPGGQLVIQNDPNPGQRSLIVSKHGPLIRRLLSEGWAIEYGFSGYKGKFGEYALDTLVLTRPAAGAKRAADETLKAWKAYAAAVAKVDADFNPFGFLFR